MAVIDLWYLKKRDADGERVKSKRYGRGKRWRVEVEGAPTAAFDRKGDAEQHEADIVSAMGKGGYVNPKDGKITVSEAAGQWRSTLMVDNATSERIERFYRLHVDDEHLGLMDLGDVRSGHIQAWVKDRAAVMAGSTMRTSYPYLTAMFDRYAEDGALPSSPCTKRIRLPEAEGAVYVLPTAKEVIALDGEVSKKFGPLAVTAASTGLRAGELFGLVRSDIDLDRREIIVARQMKRTSRHGVHIGRVKTKTSKRVAEIPEGLVKPLRDHLAAERPPCRLWNRMDRRESKHFEQDFDLVFRRPDGEPLYNGLMHYTWRRARENAGIEKVVGLHTLRHYFATVLIHKGKSVKTVQLAMGHATPTITLNTYTHEWPEKRDTTRDLLQAELFAD